jgi:hypothetical protein
MIEYTFKKVGFLVGAISITKISLILVFVAFCFATIITGELGRALLITGLVYVSIIATGLRWNIYFMQHITITDDGVHLIVFKYGKLYLDKKYSFNELSFEKQVAASSIRGVSYKMLINVNGKVISQYPINGWTEEYFNKILSSSLIKKSSKAK